MNFFEAEKYISEYRSLLKVWAMSIYGIGPGDYEALTKQLQAGEPVLKEIAALFPQTAYSVDLLVNARTRPWPGFKDERVPPPERSPKHRHGPMSHELRP